MRVLAVDTALHAARRVTRAAQVQLSGGRGTDMGAAIRTAAELRPRPSTIIILTDGSTRWPARPLARVRVVVGLLGDGQGPMSGALPEWARTVLIEDAACRSCHRP